MNDKKIAFSISETFKCRGGRNLFETCTTTIDKDGVLHLVAPQEATQYYLKQHNAIIVDIPKLDANDKMAIVQVALAVGRRLERFERGAKANATRTPNSRKQIAQNAIKKRWSAK